MGVRGAKDALRDIRDEVVELLKVSSFDEFCDELSDVMFGIGRLVAGFRGKVYVRMPGDRRHIEKINVRMMKQGCVRSERVVAKGKEERWNRK
jgi:hypothetical protein